MKKRRRGGQGFWDSEYKDGGHLALSLNPSEDLEKFTRWLEREYGNAYMNVTSSVLDLGCGNGRNLFWLAETFGIRGIGYDISGEAVSQAKRHATQKKLSLEYTARSIAGPILLPDESQSLVLDMMTSHFLNVSERSVLMKEIFRVLKPGGFLFYKTFLLDEDANAKRMLKESPGSEPNTYIHPKIGVAEHVSTEEEIYATYGALFTIEKIHKSHRHHGKNAKRRSIVAYIRKPEF
jgi:ubiquinone/menaquinone biosynthesis C-methylase UbiE